MGNYDRIRHLVEHCDLGERLALVPASAMLRGLYFKNTVSVLRKANLLTDFLEYYPESFSAVRWYPVADFLEQLAVAGALVAGPEKIHE